MKKTILGIMLITFCGCATIMQGMRQDIGVSSSPSGATITVDGVGYGITPMAVRLSRRRMHTIEISLKGYEPYSIILTKRTSGWVWGNVIFGGIIGLVVDLATGGIYQLTPDQIYATLSKNDLSKTFKSNSLYIAATLNPLPEWNKIGTLSSQINN